MTRDPKEIQEEGEVEGVEGEGEEGKVQDDDREEKGEIVEDDEERPNRNEIKYKASSTNSFGGNIWSQIKSRNCFQIMRFIVNEMISTFSPTNLRHIWIIFKKSMMILFLAKTTWSMGIYFLIIGLFFSFISEISFGPKYNSLFLLILMVSIAFSQFPQNSVRPQIVLTVLTCLTLVLDLQYLLRSPKIVSSACKSFIAFSILAKLFALYDFLLFSNGSKRARKYLIRRVRVFFIPFTRPRRLMREIRSRILALEWIQFVATVMYFGLFIASISTAGFSSIMISPHAGLPLFVFFPIKSLLSAVIFFAFVADTDLTLCLAYFGCLGWNMRYVKVYIHKKREANGGWPLPYGLNPYRFYLISAVKFVDVCWGFGGWVTLGTTFGAELNDRVIAITSATTVLLVITDIWCPILFYVVYDLLNLYKRELEYYEKNNESMESDDSELDEFNIRNDQKAISKARRSSRRHSKRMIRVESSEYDDESADSGSPNSTRRKPNRKFSRQESQKYTSVGQSGPDDLETGPTHLNITLEMALGSRLGEESSDDNDSTTDEKKYLASIDQFISSRRFPDENIEPPDTSKDAIASPAHTPSLRVDKTQEIPSIVYPPPIQEIYQDLNGHDRMITIDDSTSISPDRFTELWETLLPSATFGSLLLAESRSEQQQKLTQVINHLQQHYFYIVAAGQVGSTITIYAFHSGYVHTPEDILDIYFLMELKIYFNPPNISSGDEYNSDFWSFDCVCKCTNPAVSSVFIRLMHLGDIFQQYANS